MKNLKRALSLALASVMVLGMMVVGAGAVEFNDADKIENTDAVNTMVALGILKGKDNGSFDPEGIVTRAEMAKMICVALNGGTDPNLNEGGMYPDTKTHWARGYIDYCTNLGIVSGDNLGNFNPDKTITGTEAAKMILIALGYNAETEKFVNDVNWAININVKASTKGLYADVPVNPASGLSRDNAAQMVFNGVQAIMVRYTFGIGGSGGNITGIAIAEDDGTKTILNNVYKTYVTDPEGIMASFTYNPTKETWTYEVDGKNFTTDKDFTALMGRKVRVIAQPAGDKTVFGIYAIDSEVIAEGFSGDIAQPTASADKVKIDGTEYKLDTTANRVNISYFKTGTVANTLDNVDAITSAYSYVALDNDEDGKIDSIVITPFTVAKVTYVGKDSMTMNKTVGPKDFEDIIVYDGVAKDDYVVYTASTYATTDKDTVVEAEVETGTLSGVKSGEYLLDGVWMTNATGESLNVNDTIEYVSFGSVIYFAKITDGDSYTKDVAFVYTAADVKGSDGLTSNVHKAALMFTDGKKETVVTEADYESLIGQMVTYRVNNDDEYVLTPVSNTNKAGYDSHVNATVGGSTTISKVGSFDIADDAVVFLYKWEETNYTTAHASNNVKLITGKEAKDLAITSYDTTAATALVSKVNGFNYAKVVSIIPDTAAFAFPTTFAGGNYGYLTADAYESVVGGKSHLNFKIWTGDEVITASAKTDDDAKHFVAGTVVTYDTVDASTVKNVKVPTTTTSAVTGYDGAKKVQIYNSTTTKITDDTTILYVDSNKTIGAEGGSIEIADDPNGNGIEAEYTANVRYIANTAKTEYVLLVVDVNNKMEDLPAVTLASPSANDIAAALAVTNTVSVSGTVPTVAIPEHKFMILEGTVASTGTISGDGTVVLGDVQITGTVDTAIDTHVAGEVRLGASADLTVPAATTYEVGAGYKVTKGAALTLDSTVVTDTLTGGDFTVTHNGKGTNYVLTDAITLGANLTIAANDTLVVKTSLALAGNTLTIRNTATLKAVTATTGGSVVVASGATVTVTGTSNFYTAAGNGTTAGTTASTLSEGTYAWGADNVYTDTSGTQDDAFLKA